MSETKFRLLLMRVMAADHTAEDLKRVVGVLDKRTMVAREDASNLTEELVKMYKEEHE